MRLVLACLVLGSVTEAGELVSLARPAVAGIPTTPLQTLSSTRAPLGDYFAWAGPALCDANDNSYFLAFPPITPGVARMPSAVLRISADGQKRFSFTPAAVPELTRASKLRTLGFALDPEGGVFMLIQQGRGGEIGQYIVSFDKNGDYRSYFEVDSREIFVQQFEVFGSGQFLLLGRRPGGEQRLVILSDKGAGLKDVVGWSRLHKPWGEAAPAQRGIVRLNQVARGGDGRIYIAEFDARQGKDVVYAFRPSGEGEAVFTLHPLPEAPELLGWKVAGDRIAAAYRKPDPQPDGRRGSYWIAVYDTAPAGGDPQPKVYGPAPGTPVCYRHEVSGDRFTFLQAGRLVTMSAP